jgi:hypothetical protein
MLRKLLICAALVAGSAGANAGPLLLDEGFDDFILPDWYYVNVGNTGVFPYFQGNSGVFASQSGAPDSYAAINTLNGSPAGFVDAWLITPLLSVTSGVADLTFSTRTTGDFPEGNLQILVSNGDTLGDLSSYVSLGLIASASFPADWTSFTFRYHGDEGSNVRFAFRYLVDDVTVQGDYIGIDSVQVEVPEPGTLALLAMGMLLTPLVLRRRRARI